MWFRVLDEKRGRMSNLTTNIFNGMAGLGNSENSQCGNGKDRGSCEMGWNAMRKVSSFVQEEMGVMKCFGP